MIAQRSPLVIMVLHHLHRVQEWLAVLNEPTDEFLSL